MTESKALQEAVKFEVQVYHPPADFDELKKTHVPFTGSPRKHPHDNDIIILLIDPYSTHKFYYEFRKDDVSYVEELPSIVNIDNETVANARVWVKKKTVGLRCTPFIVDDI